MKNLFVPYEIAKKIKELGFSEGCIGMFVEENFFFINNPQKPIDKHDFYYNQDCLAPLWQQVEEWLFKEYNIFIEIKKLKVMADPEDDLYVYYCEVGDFSSQHYKTPKQALRKGIEEAIKLIK